MAVDREEIKRKAILAIDRASDDELERGSKDKQYAESWLQNAIGFIVNLITIIGAIFACFLATASIKRHGGNENHQDLDILRQYRDQHLINNPEFRKFVDLYYQMAPSTVSWINSRKDSEEIWKYVDELMAQCIRMIQENKYDDVFNIFREQILEIRKDIAIGMHSEYLRNKEISVKTIELENERQNRRHSESATP